MGLPTKYVPLIQGLAEHLREPVRTLEIREVCEGVPLYYPDRDECFWILIRRSLLGQQRWSLGQEPTAEMKAVCEALISSHRAAIGSSTATLRTTSVPEGYVRRFESEWQSRWPGMAGVDGRPAATILPGASAGATHVQPFIVH